MKELIASQTMKTLIETLSMKYNVPVDKVQGIVTEVVDQIEKDLPVTVAEKLETDLDETADDSLLKRSAWGKTP
jgi:LPS sulfotransferase NodH